MNKIFNHKYLFLAVTIIAGLGMAFAIPALVKAQHTIISRQSSGFGAVDISDPGSFDMPCPSFPMTAADKDQLNFAIDCYNLLLVPGTYTVTLKNNINLSSSTPAIDNPTPGVSLYLDGAGYTVDCQDLAGVRPFEILSGTHTTMSKITIMGGNTAGLPDTDGGGINNEGHLTLMDSSLTDNHAVGDGGGIYNNLSGNVTIKNSTIFSNTAEDGGGINNSDKGILTMTDSTVGWNSAVDKGGGIKNTSAARMLIKDSRIISNTTSTLYDAGGGGFYLTGGAKTTILDSSISANTSTQRGGGVYITSGHAATITNSTINNNKTGVFGGGIGLKASASLTMTNSTVSGNQVTTDTLNSEIGGSGIAAFASSQLNIKFSTIVSNTLTGLKIREGIMITDSASLTMASSILANHFDDCKVMSASGSFFDGGYNLVEDGSCIIAGTSLSGDPLTGLLQDNTGPTKTHALLDGSQAIDHIPTGSCDITEDQRSYTRPAMEGCDIGAFERSNMYYQPIIFKE